MQTVVKVYLYCMGLSWPFLVLLVVFLLVSAHQGLSGHVWAFQGLSGLVWAILDLFGPVWTCLALFGIVCAGIGLPELT